MAETSSLYQQRNLQENLSLERLRDCQQAEEEQALLCASGWEVAQWGNQDLFNLV